MNSKDFITESVSTIYASGNLHSAISNHLEQNGGHIEDWQDQARVIMGWIREVGGVPITAKQPERTATEMDHDGGYLYRVQFTDADGSEKWLAFSEDIGIADILDHMPDPLSYS